MFNLSVLLLSMPDFSNPEIWLSLVTLTFLEIVLGIDNIIFISIAANKLNENQQPVARNVGLSLAMLFRILLLFGISYLIAMSAPWFNVDFLGLHAGFSGQSLILFAGGIFLIYKATTEIHHKLEGHEPDKDENNATSSKNLTNIILQITLINIVFSFDSILTAVGLTKDVMIMIIAVVLSVLIMMLFAGPVGRFVNKHPSIQMLGMSFLLLIGFMLIAEGAHLAHMKVGSSEIGSVPKGYLYFAIAFSLLVEFLNMRLRKRQQPIQLHGIGEEAAQEGILET